jgi:tyrosyl-tRNA synthetase
MDFLEELKWRGMLHDLTPGVEEVLAQGPCTGYIGFDPTAPSLTIGNYVQIMLLKLFQLSGHRPIVLMGGATGRIGDPSGKDAERELKTYDALDHNLRYQQKLFGKFLEFGESGNGARMVNNLDFYKDMGVIDFLREVGKTVTVNYMTSKESVKRRIETGISFTEFSYQLLQGYDFQRLYEKHGCVLQMGGSDQWGNITTGTEFVRRNLGGKAYAITTPLLTKSDGSKFGKSTKGNLWIDPAFTSPYEFYQFWMKCDDADLPRFVRYFTLKSREETEAMEAEYADRPQRIKEIFAEELTTRIFSLEAFRSAYEATQTLFGKGGGKDALQALDLGTLEAVATELDALKIEKHLFANGTNIVELLADRAGIMASRADVRRAIKGNALAVNKEKVVSDERTVTADELLHGRFLLIENGKKNKYMLDVS